MGPRRYIRLLAVCFFLSACSNIHIEDERELRVMPPTAPKTIYVKDFDLEPGSFQAESGILPLSPISPGVPGVFIPRLLGVPEDNAVRARELVKLCLPRWLKPLPVPGSMHNPCPRAGSFPTKVGWCAARLFN
jgi:hypothetical protein